MRMRAFRKRGDAAALQAGFVAIGLLLALIVAGGFIKKTIDDVKGTTFEKNYIAREVALALDAVYASPARIEYNYSMREYKFVVELRNSRVFVKDDACDEDGLSGFYDYFDGLGDDPDGNRLSYRISPTLGAVIKPTVISFVKDGDAVTITVENGKNEKYGELKSCKK